MANLILADLEGLLIFISRDVGLITFLLYFSKRKEAVLLSSGKYLDGFDLFFEKLLKNYLTILSSIE